ncbi:GTP-binding protein ERG [Camellia lanceoleosa]|uniref:GTP-binding protein ERG n=1 Tax=Camellia lanceoleosa TaxID=1840588 RepID=A0ACC0FTH1_9ERIC|nr:GTP-binding protein ERG [Camellia lanceoleosa]
MTKGNTQICFFDTPGLMLKKSGFPHNDMKVRVESAWSSVDLYDVLIIIFDVHRHLNSPGALLWFSSWFILLCCCSKGLLVLGLLFGCYALVDAVKVEKAAERLKKSASEGPP